MKGVKAQKKVKHTGVTHLCSVNSQSAAKPSAGSIVARTLEHMRMLERDKLMLRLLENHSRSASQCPRLYSSNFELFQVCPRSEGAFPSQSCSLDKAKRLSEAALKAQAWMQIITGASLQSSVYACSCERFTKVPAHCT